MITDFHKTKRDLVLAIDPSLYPEIEGTTDSEVLFHVALTFGLEDDPPAAVARAIGLVEATGRDQGIEHPFQGTIATTDGERIWAFRYSSERKSRSLFFSTNVLTLRELYPENELLRNLSDEARLVVSEPLGDELPGAWNEVPEGSYGVIQPGQDELRPFIPTAEPAGAVRAR
jgi:glutamine amidotransferase